MLTELENESVVVTVRLSRSSFVSLVKSRRYSFVNSLEGKKEKMVVQDKGINISPYINYYLWDVRALQSVAAIGASPDTRPG